MVQAECGSDVTRRGVNTPLNCLMNMEPHCVELIAMIC